MRGVMDHNYNKDAGHLPDFARGPRPEDLNYIATCLISKGGSEFVYDKELDVFRFEDGRFAFCEEFADWKLLEERGSFDY
jgi:hypothetical protein